MRNDKREERVSAALRSDAPVEVRAALGMLLANPDVARPAELSPEAWEAARAMAGAICCEMIDDTATLFRPSPADPSSAHR